MSKRRRPIDADDDVDGHGDNDDAFGKSMFMTVLVVVTVLLGTIVMMLRQG